MYALIFLAALGAFAGISEFVLWKLFTRGVTDIQFQRPLMPRFLHVSTRRRMMALALLHLAFTWGMLAVAFLVLW